VVLCEGKMYKKFGFVVVLLRLKSYL
jgi:hypothetical protein